MTTNSNPYEQKAQQLLPLIYDIAQGKAAASTLVIAIAAALSQAVEAERERCAKILQIAQKGLDNMQPVGNRADAKQRFEWIIKACSESATKTETGNE